MEDTELRRIETRSLVTFDPLQAAERAELIYVSDTEPGLRRMRSGKGFRYLDPDGDTVRDKVLISRIKALAIPPAWTDVWISTDDTGHIQATGRDLKGRKQYRYHPSWTACRDEAKFSSLADFARLLPKLRQRADEDLRRRTLSRERALASVVWLLDHTMIRIGNDAYARENRSYGLTTLRRRHVEVEGSRLRFSFVGKSGQEWKLKLTDRRIASVLRSMHELPGQRLFKYLDDDGTRCEIQSHDVNAYIQETIGDIYTSKHFRTWGATTRAAFLLSSTPLPETQREQNRVLNAVVDKVAARLHNTRAVCRRCYIHPAVVQSWADGALVDEMQALRRRLPRPLAGLDQDESTVVRWLASKDQSSPG